MRDSLEELHIIPLLVFPENIYSLAARFRVERLVVFGAREKQRFCFLLSALTPVPTKMVRD